MKKLEFREELKREDWEPLDGKWYVMDGSTTVFTNFTLYNVKVTRLGILLYLLNGMTFGESESYKSFGKYGENGFQFTPFKLFIDEFCDGKLHEIDEEDAGFFRQKFEEKERLSNEFMELNEERTKKLNEIDKELRN